MQPSNDGWDNNPIDPYSGIAYCLDNPFPPPPSLHSMSHIASTISMDQLVHVPRN
jgi:hypothetical protein